MPDDGDREPLAEWTLEPDPFPAAAEPMLMAHILLRKLRQEVRDARLPS